MDHTTLAQLPDEALRSRFEDLVHRSHGLTAEILAHLSEVDARRLYLGLACSSMYVYLVERLGFDEVGSPISGGPQGRREGLPVAGPILGWSAAKRIQAARLARRFPAVLGVVAEGALHLAGVCLLAPHMNEQNHLELLALARGKSKRQIEQLLADRAPKPTVAPTIRKAPEPAPRAPAAATGAATASLDFGTPPAAPERETRHDKGEVAPLGAKRYLVKLTASEEFVGKLRRAQTLLSHVIPDGDLAAVLDRALTLLCEHESKRRFGARSEPRANDNDGKGAGAKAGRAEESRRSRAIPAFVRRRVYERDGGQCTFVDASGRRCAETRYLTFDHIEPYAMGGVPDIRSPEGATGGPSGGRSDIGGEHGLSNVRLLCAAHNLAAAREVYGPEHIDRRIRERMRADEFGANLGAFPGVRSRDPGGPATSSGGALAASGPPAP